MKVMDGTVTELVAPSPQAKKVLGLIPKKGDTGSLCTSTVAVRIEKYK